MARRTNPRVPSAPLPDDTGIFMPSQEVIHPELERAGQELLWALHRHRLAWAKMERLKVHYDAKGQEYKDNERAWKIAVGDVQWWRGEVNARSNSILALQSLAAWHRTIASARSTG